jgi:hypothetical protein
MKQAHDPTTCEGCRPAMLDVKTREVLPDDHPLMTIANKIYDALSPDERRAWHRFTCLNARDVEALTIARRFYQRLERMAKESEPTS